MAEATSSPSDPDALTQLNADDVAPYQDGDVMCFERILADDFMSSKPDFLLRDKKPFLETMSQRRLLTDLTADDVPVHGPEQPARPGQEVTAGRLSRRTGGDLAVALGRIGAKVVDLPIGSDMTFTGADCAAEQELIQGSERKVLETHCGHAGLFGMDPQYRHQMDDAFGHLLAQPA